MLFKEEVVSLLVDVAEVWKVRMFRLNSRAWENMRYVKVTADFTPNSAQTQNSLPLRRTVHVNRSSTPGNAA